jgi:O-succinylbenzoate synthase
MKIANVELRIIHLPLVRPFRTSFGTQIDREILMLKVTTTEGVIGWSECVAMSEPLYSSEYLAECMDVIKRFFLPALFQKGEFKAEEISEILRPFLGHPMAKAAVETACLGAVKTKVECGVSVGIAPSIEQLIEEVTSYVEAGYRRIKLKIEPGWDIIPVGKIRELFPSIPLQVDANQAYSRTDGPHLAQLDPFNLLLIEQPLDEHDILGHAELAKVTKTPICLDESIISLQSAKDAIAMGATTVINIKPGRASGYLESKRIHDFCLSKKIPVWCGGMLETGIGRSANLALAALPGFTLPGDTSASSRYYKRDITNPFIMNDGYLEVPNTEGIGVEPDLDFLESLTKHKELITQ